MDLPRLLFGVGFQNFYSDASSVYVISSIYRERSRLIATTATLTRLCIGHTNLTHILH